MRKKFLPLLLALVMTLSLLPTAASAAKVDVSNMPNHAVLARLPETLPRPARPTTLEQAYVHVDNVKLGNKWSDESTLREITDLVDSLTAGKRTDTQKMKAIFDWVTQNIEYDYVALEYHGLSPWERTDEEAERAGEAFNVFSAYTNRKAVCDGYSDLCWLMGTIAGIPVAYIDGAAAHGAGHHAWNAALVDGKWLFFDATWGEWDMGPDYHNGTSFFVYYDGLYQLSVGTDIISLRLRQGFQDQCPASVTIPSFVTIVDGNAFEGCTNLERVTIPNSVNTIWSGAFSGCTSLKSITIPDSVTEVEGYLFAGCTSLESVTLPNSVTRIWQGTFDGCTSLKSITIPGSITEMEAAFYGCSALESVTLGRGITSIGFAAFQDCTGLKSITIPDTVTTIEGQAFWGCTSLESVTIPEGVTTIEKLAFAECENLKYADLPDSVTSVDGSAFFGCPNLQGMATIPAGMTRIADGMFDGRTDLTSFVIPDHITEIGYWSFRDCTNLKSITIPNSVTVIGNSSFMGCSGLTSITIPSSVTTIEAWAFAGCRGLTSVFIPDSVTEIQVYALAGGNISDVYYGGTEEQWKAIQGDGKDMPHTTIHYNSAGPRPASYTATPTNDTLKVNGVVQKATVYKIDGANYFRIRDVAILLSGSKRQVEVGYDAATNSVTLTTGKPYTPNGSELSGLAPASGTAEPSNDVIYIDGKKAELTVYKIDGSNYFKLRDLGIALDFNVGWTAADGVYIEPNKPYDPNN